MSDSKQSPEKKPDLFATTHWSVVQAAGAASSTSGQKALAALCETYWYPLYVFVRHRGFDSSVAEDLTQEFFAQLLERNDLGSLRRERGKFRAFLLASLKHFLANEWDRARAQKRGGDRQLLSLDFAKADGRYAVEVWHEHTPEAVYDRQWAMTLIQQTTASLGDEYKSAGKGELFAALRPYLTYEHDLPKYAELADEMGLTESAVKVAVHRLRKRFGELLRDQIAQTLTEHEDVDDEIRALFDALRC